MNYRVKNIGIAIGLAALAAILTSVYVVNYKRHVQRGEGKVTVLVAARDIPAGTSGADVIDQKMLKEQTVPRKSIVAGAISTPDQLSQYVATQDVYEGEQVSTRRFAPPSEQGIRAQIKGTQRAYQLPGTSDQLLAGTIQNGDHVDVVGTWEVGDTLEQWWDGDDRQPRRYSRRARAPRAGRHRLGQGHVSRPGRRVRPVARHGRSSSEAALDPEERSGPGRRLLPHVAPAE